MYEHGHSACVMAVGWLVYLYWGRIERGGQNEEGKMTGAGEVLQRVL